jgi:peroxiredoxin
MTALKDGGLAPDFALPDSRGKTFSLSGMLATGPVVLAFFKVTCPVCQFTFPYLERIFRGGAGRVNLLGVSQNPARETNLFASEYGLTFPLLLDEPGRYPVSNAYGITHVPTVFLVSSEGRVELGSVGWSRQEIEDLARRLGQALQLPPPQAFSAGEDVPAFTAG